MRQNNLINLISGKVRFMKMKTGVLLLLIFTGFSFLEASPGYSLDIIALASGSDHTVALRFDRTVWTWGSNGNGQLGDGSWNNQNVPTRVAMLSDIVSIAAGDADSFAIRADGTLWAWGWNAYSQLGDGTVDQKPTPVQIMDPLNPTKPFGWNHGGVVEVAASYRHTLARMADGTVWAWGYNYSGQLGDDTTLGKSTPVQVKTDTGYLNNVIALSASDAYGGNGHSVALKADGTVWTWGTSVNYAVGRPLSGPGSTRQTVAAPVPGIPQITAIATGLTFGVALAADKTVYTWGWNASGQLGDGSTTSRSSPAAVPNFSNAVAIAASNSHTLAVKQDGSVWAWGSNYGGMLCDSTITNKLSPIPMDSLSGVKAAVAGGEFNLALKTDGTIFGCGYNYWGQLGTGAFSGNNPISAPVQTVMPPLKMVYLWGLDYIVPGEEATFLVAYENLNNTILDQAVVVANFPKTFRYVSSTGGGIHRDDQPTNQVFWKLGAVPAGAKGQLTLKAEVPWGMPLHTSLMAAVELGARNTTPRFDIEEYLAWQPNLVSEIKLSPADIQQRLIQDPNLKDLLQYATKTLGRYVFLNVAKRFEYRDGTGMTCFTLLDTQNFGPAFLYSNGQAAFIEKLEGSMKIRFDSQGGYSEDMVDGSVQVWGRWAGTTGILFESQIAALAPNLGDTPPAQNIARCMMNCMVNRGFRNHWNLGVHMIEMSNANLRMTCQSCSQSLAMGVDELDVPGCISCMDAWDASIEKYNGVAGECVYECRSFPSHHICTNDNRFCYHAVGLLGYTFYSTEGSTGETAALQRCNPKTGTYEDHIWKLSCDPRLFEECKQGVCTSDQPNCPTRQPEATSPLPLNIPGVILNSDLAGPAGCPCEFFNTFKSETRTAHDPNIKSSNVKGDVLPGETVTYTVEYENLGAGTAYGVYILDKLDTNLDESTLVINNGGAYRASTRLLTWDIGTVVPGGKGSVSFSVKVTAGVAAGTSIVNKADVYFPSANEVTPTNAVIHQVKGLVANPQALNVVSGAPLSITLTGKDSGSKPLTFQITSPVGYGTLTGTPPTLSYISSGEFVGQDEFSFTVNNGLETSGPALVKINVSFNPQDSKRPTIVSTSPKASSSGVPLTPTPVQSNPDRYAPLITAVFSEPLDPSTVSGTTFTINGGLTGQVMYDELARTAFYIPSKALNYSTTYTAKLTAGIKDKKGNPLAAEYSWQFTTQSQINLQVGLPDQAAEINFGGQAVNVLSPAKTISLASTGIANLNVGSASLTGANGSDFKIIADTCSGKTLAPSQGCTIQMGFQPLYAGQRTGSLSIPSNDPDLPSASINLKGLGIGSNSPGFIWLPLILRP
jgi:uncharacterized repeat protein (TIGR01451 family)